MEEDVHVEGSENATVIEVTALLECFTMIYG